jgi:hypothetical protein
MHRSRCRAEADRLARPSDRLKTLQSEKFHNLQLIEAHHRLPVNKRHWGALKPLIDQLFHRRFIGADIFLDKLNTLLR